MSDSERKPWHPRDAAIKSKGQQSRMKDYAGKFRKAYNANGSTKISGVSTGRLYSWGKNGLVKRRDSGYYFTEEAETLFERINKTEEAIEEMQGLIEALNIHKIESES